MKNRLLIALSLVCITANAQKVKLENEEKYYEAKYFESHVWNEATQDYEMDARTWTTADFVLHKEYVVFGVRNEKYHKLWWVFYDENKNLGDCYITEGDAIKVCIDYEDNKIFFMTDYDESKERWTEVGLFAKIQSIRPFNYSR